MGHISRTVHFKIRNGKEQDFETTFERTVLPELRRQEGFKGELVLKKDAQQAMGISLWKDRAAADTYQKSAYPKVLETLTPMLDGTPRVEVCDVPFMSLS